MLLLILGQTDSIFVSRVLTYSISAPEEQKEVIRETPGRNLKNNLERIFLSPIFLGVFMETDCFLAHPRDACSHDHEAL